MINYSISKRLVKGKESEGIKRVYAYAQSDLYMSIEQFAEHIASHGSLYSEDIVEGVLKKAVKCMVEKLKEGYYAIALMNKGLWTSSGHFVVLWWQDGKVRINDPASTKDARVNGDIQTFRSQAKYYWLVDARAYNKEEDEVTQ